MGGRSPPNVTWAAQYYPPTSLRVTPTWRDVAVTHKCCVTAGTVTTPRGARVVMGSRSWVFTLFGASVLLGGELFSEPLEGDIRYVVWQLEKAPTTEEVHVQGYVEFTKPQRRPAVQRALRNETAHVEPRRGSRDQAREYARKEDTRFDGPWEVGVWIGGRGDRTDLVALLSDLEAGHSLRLISNDHFASFLRYNRGIHLWRLLNVQRRFWKPEVYVFHGPTGTGKTRAAWQIAGEEAYILTPQQAASGVGWWDGYDLHEDVIIDEFYGWLRYSFLLQLLDQYPIRVEFKGGSVEFVARRIFLTSNKRPEDWYDSEKFPYPPLYRRIDHIYQCDDEVFTKTK